MTRTMRRAAAASLLACAACLVHAQALAIQDRPVPAPPAVSQQAQPAPQPSPAFVPPDAPNPAKPVPTPPRPAGCKAQPCPVAIIDWYTRFMNGPQVKPLTPREKARLAAKNLLDPFNAITIFGTAAISVGSNPDSPYGPGMPGFGRYVGVSYTQDLTGEFFNTFLIPSLMHQDPHYHRMPHASIVRRIAHTAEQVVWTQGDNGRGMLNYATLAGYAIDDEIGNLYVPGRQTNLPASATRYGVGLALSPIDNIVTEFLPDVARRIHVRVVIVQQIINQIAKTDAVAAP